MASKKGIAVTAIILDAITGASFLVLYIPQDIETTIVVKGKGAKFIATTIVVTGEGAQFIASIVVTGEGIKKPFKNSNASDCR